jgi:hypothetical protein
MIEPAHLEKGGRILRGRPRRRRPCHVGGDRRSLPTTGFRRTDKGLEAFDQYT